MVVPLLCLIIVAILHFGKVMNYWLDLNHVASEGARKAAVNTFASDGAYETYLRQPAGDGRAPHRRYGLDPGAEHDQCLPAGRRRRRRPGEGSGRGRLQHAADRQDDHPSRQRHDAAGAARRLRGRRNMRVSVGGIADLAAREEGGILVFVAMLTPILLLFLALSVDIGNWWVHKRHLQLQVDAAALAGGALLGDCFSRPGGRERGDHQRGDPLRRRGRVELQRAARRDPEGDGGAQLPEQQLPVGAADPSGDTETEAPCDTAHLMLDVKASEVGIPLLLRPLLELVAPGSAFADPTINTHARVRAEAGRDPGGDAARRRPGSPLQLCLRDVRQRGHRRRSRHGAADEGRLERREPALEHDALRSR